MLDVPPIALPKCHTQWPSAIPVQDLEGVDKSGAIEKIDTFYVN